MIANDPQPVAWLSSTLRPRRAAGRGPRGWLVAWLGAVPPPPPPPPSPPRRAPLARPAAAPRPPGRHERRSGRSAPRVSARPSASAEGERDGGREGRKEGKKGGGSPSQTEDNFMGRRVCAAAGGAPLLRARGEHPRTLPRRRRCPARRRGARGCCLSPVFCS